MTMLRGAILSLGVRAVGVILMLAMHVLLARSLTLDDYGIVTLVIQAAGLGTVVVSVGMSQLAVQQIPTMRRKQDSTGILEFIRAGLLVIGIVTLIFYALFSAAKTLLSEESNSIELLEFARFGLFISFSLAVLRFFQQVARCHKHIFASQAGEEIFLPLLMIALCFWVSESRHVFTVFSVGPFLPSLFLFYRYYFVSIPSANVFSFQGHQLVGGRLGGWIVASLPLGYSVLLANLILRGDILVLGVTLSPSEVAIYGVAAKIVMPLGFGLTAVSAISGPLFTELWGNRQTSQLQEKIFEAIVLSGLISLPLCLIILVFAEQILGIFGPEYIAASMVLRILVFGQFFSVLMGPVVPLLVSLGLGKSYLKITVITCVLSLSSIFFLSTYLGVTGAAIAVSVCFCVMNAVCAWVIFKNTDLISLPPKRFKHYAIKLTNDIRALLNSRTV